MAWFMYSKLCKHMVLNYGINFISANDVLEQYCGSF